MTKNNKFLSIKTKKSDECYKKNVRNIYIIFLVLFLLATLSPYYDFPYYIYGVRTLQHFFKIPLIGMFLIGLFFHFFKKPILSYESLLFIAFGSFSLGMGIFKNHEKDSAMLSHLFTAIMPVVFISFGIHFAKNFDSKLRKCTLTTLRIATVMVFVALALYIYFYHIRGVFGYYGFGTPIPLIMAFLLSQGSYLACLIGFVLAIYSGKRSSLVVIIFLILIFVIKKTYSHFRRKGFFVQKKWILIAIPLALFCWKGFQFAEERNYFRRFKMMTQLNFSNELSLFYATGGRLTESISVAKYFENNPVQWITGAGMGARYPLIDPRYDTPVEEFHYVHFSPMSYVFLYGLPFTLLLYYGFARSLYKAAKNFENFFYLAFLALFIGSFFGSKLFTDPKVWFFYGVVKFMGGTRKGLL